MRERRFSEIRETLFIHSLHTTILFSLQNLSLSLSLLSQHTNLHIHRQTNKQTNKYICIYIYRYTHTYSMTDMRRQRETGTEKHIQMQKNALHIQYALLSSKGLLHSKFNPPHHSTMQISKYHKLTKRSNWWMREEADAGGTWAPPSDLAQGVGRLPHGISAEVHGDLKRLLYLSHHVAPRGELLVLVRRWRGRCRLGDVEGQKEE